jgi:hypothetical protein
MQQAVLASRKYVSNEDDVEQAKRLLTLFGSTIEAGGAFMVGLTEQLLKTGE